MCVPSSCPSTIMPGTKRYYSDRSHRVCQGCWFPSEENPNSAFARENESHICPGCEKGQLPNPPLQQPPNPEIVDLVSDSDEDAPPPIPNPPPNPPPNPEIIDLVSDSDED